MSKEIPFFHKRGWRTWAVVVVFLVVVIGVWHATLKPLPEGISYESEVREVPAEDVRFLFDLTYTDRNGERVHDQEIFDRVFELIDGADEYILIDMFLMNDYTGTSTEDPFRNLYGELTKKLIDKKQTQPNIVIDLVTDPINQVYSGVRLEEFQQLESVGVNVIETDVRLLRDSNPIYSALWRSVVAPFGANPKSDWLPNPFDANAEGVGVRNWLSLMNFKANHRKVLISDHGDTMTSLIMSANPHNGSSAHSNVAMEISGEFWKEIYRSEQAVARMSGGELSGQPWYSQEESTDATKPSSQDMVRVRLVTEGKIKESLIEEFQKVGPGDRVDIAMFYLSEREVIQNLVQASERGATIRLILDANKDAFGYEKIGIPNRQAAHTLYNNSDEEIQIRWYVTEGEQFHSKMVVVESGGVASILLGSANLTRRNIGDFNLESNVWVETKNESKLYGSVRDYYEKMWENTGSGVYTVDYREYQEDVWWKNWLYRVQEFTGLSSF